MIDEYDAETLRLHVANVEAKTAELAEAVAKRDAQIRGMLKKGGMPTEIGAVAGMTRGRIHQIRNGTR